MRNGRPIFRFLYPGQVLYGFVMGAGLLFIYAHVSRGLYPLGAIVLDGIVLAFSTLAFFVYLENLYKKAPAADYSEDCHACGSRVNRYSEFCEHCGADLMYEEKIVHCPSCATEVFDHVAFCPACGTDMQGTGKGA